MNSTQIQSLGFLELEGPAQKNTTHSPRTKTKIAAAVLAISALLYFSYSAGVVSASKAPVHNYYSPGIQHQKKDQTAYLYITAYKLCNPDTSYVCKRPGYRVSFFDSNNVVRLCIGKVCQADQAYWVGGSQSFSFDIARESEIKKGGSIPIEICYLRDEETGYDANAKPLQQKFTNCVQTDLAEANLIREGKDWFGNVKPVKPYWELFYVARPNDQFGTFIDNAGFNAWVGANRPGAQ